MVRRETDFILFLYNCGIKGNEKIILRDFTQMLYYLEMLY